VIFTFRVAKVVLEVGMGKKNVGKLCPFVEFSPLLPPEKMRTFLFSVFLQHEF